jgi:hypothetical protein
MPEDVDDWSVYQREGDARRSAAIAAVVVAKAKHAVLAALDSKKPLVEAVPDRQVTADGSVV